MENAVFRLATRGSKLALWQAEYIKQKLAEHAIRSELIIVKTLGDKNQKQSLQEIGGKGVFVKEIQKYLLDKKADFAVHSMKDLPARTESPFTISATTTRHSPFDVIIFNRQHKKRLINYPTILDIEHIKSLGQLKIATGSLRRAAILREAKNTKCFPIRGNVDTRLKKLEEDGYDAIILAEAALERLELKDKLLAFTLKPEWFTPCSAQGAIAIESLEGQSFNKKLSKINCNETQKLVSIEREVLHRLGGDCTIPAGVYCKKQHSEIICNIFVEHKGDIVRSTSAVPTNTPTKDAADKFYKSLRK